MKFREIRPDDAVTLLHLRTRTRENAYTLEQLRALGIDAESVAQRLTTTFKGWLCTEGDQVVGFCIADRATGELWVIAVLPEHEGRGIGRSLMTFAADWFRTSCCTRAWLTTDLDPSLRAYGFYRRLGWTDWKIEGGLRWMELVSPGSAIDPGARTRENRPPLRPRSPAMDNRVYPNTQLLIAGEWMNARSGRTMPVVNPASGETIGTLAYAEQADLDHALDAVDKGFVAWKKISAYERSKLMRKAADLLRQRVDLVSRLMTMEQGKTLAEAKAEILNGADTIDWFAEEARRTYGRVIPARGEGIYQLVIKEPVGPVAAFTPWNFPINQIVRKLSAALAAGCSIIVKAPEETPASPAELIRAFVDAGVPPGVINLVYGDPAQISSYLIPHPVIRKISFTGSTVVGKQLAALAGAHMKRATMELGGHAPVIVFDDADAQVAAKAMAASKFRNAGQVCISPTRFLVQEGIYDAFVDAFVANTKALKVGNGLDADVRMGSLANPRRSSAMDANLEDATRHGAKVRTGGHRIGDKGNFYEPTVVTELPNDAKAMNEEPFGPMAIINPFKTFDDAVKEANRLPFGLAAYAWTKSAKTANAIAAQVETGMMSINHVGLGIPEVPFGGVKDSGYGSEGGSEAIEPYLNPKFVTQAGL